MKFYRTLQPINSLWLMVSKHKTRCLVFYRTRTFYHSTVMIIRDCSQNTKCKRGREGGHEFIMLHYMGDRGMHYAQLYPIYIIGILISLHLGFRSWVFRVNLSWTANGWAIRQWKKNIKPGLRFKNLASKFTEQFANDRKC